MCTTIRTMARKPCPSSTPRPPSTALRCSTWRYNRRGWTRRRPGGWCKAAQPDWVILRSTGVMTPTALKAAAQVGVPRDKIVGTQAACAEQGTVPAGEAAIGYICASFLGTGNNFPLIQDILTYVYARGKGPGPEGDVGTESLEPWRAGCRARHRGAPHGHAPLRQPAPDGGAGTVGARPPQPHRRVSQGDGGGGPVSPAHPLVPGS